jgi:TRAP-type uncharacterized transport system substrate-binding protein
MDRGGRALFEPRASGFGHQQGLERAVDQETGVLQVLVSERASLDGIADLRGRRISLGARSSGAAP